MKKKIAALFLTLVLLACNAAPALAATELNIYMDHVYYGASTGKVLRLEGSNKDATYVIHDSVNGHTVTELSSTLLWGRKVETTLVIPDTVQITNNLGASDLSKVIFVCEAGTPAANYANANGITNYTKAENQYRMDSKEFHDKTITVYYNHRPLTGWVESKVESANFKLAVDDFLNIGEKTTVTLTEADGSVKEIKLKNGSETINGSDAALLTVTRTGGITDFWKNYETQEIPFKELKDEHTIYLEPVTDEIKIRSVTMDYLEDDGSTTNADAYHDDCYIDSQSDKATTLRASVDWNGHPEGEIVLWQDGKEAAFTKGVLTYVLKNQFDTTKDLFLIARSGGSEVKTKLSIKPFDLGKLNKLQFGLGTFKLPIPDKIPMLGGETLDVDILDFPLDITLEDGKVYIVVGIYDLEGSSAHKNHGNGKTTSPKEVTKKDERFTNFKGVFDDIKKGVTDAKKDAGRVANLFKSFKNKTFKNTSTSKRSISGEVEILGYAEGVIRPNGLAWRDGGIVVQLGGKLSWGGQYSLGPVPMRWAITLSADGEGKLSISKIVCLIADIDNQPFLPLGTVSAKVSLGGDTGPGVGELLGVGIGIRGTAKGDIAFKTDTRHQKLGGQIDIYARAFAAFLSWEKSWKIAEGTWSEKDIPYKKSKEAVYLSEDDDWDELPDLYAELYDLNSYHVQDQSYLDEWSDFTANDPQLMEFGTNMTQMQTNVYRMPAVQLVELEDGSQIQIWLGGAPGRESPNKTAVYYSYKPANGIWSTPEIVDDDGTADFQPILVSAGNTAWLAWQNAGRVVDNAEAGDPEASASLMEICAAEFWGTGFGPVSRITDDEIYDHSPAIALDETGGAIFWLSSSSNDLMGTDTDTEIMCAELQSGNCGAPTVVYTPEHPVKSLAAGCDGGSLHWAAAVDMDDDIYTSDDMELFVDGSRFTNNDVVDSGPTFCNGTMYWYQDGMIYDEDYTPMLPDGVKLDVDRFSVYEDETGRTAVVFSHCRGLTAEEAEEEDTRSTESEVYASFRDPGKESVSQLTALTDYREHIEAGAGYYHERTGLVLPCALTTITGEVPGAEDGSEDPLPFGRTDLYHLNYGEESHLSIDGVYFDTSRLVSGNNFTVNVSVKNTGALPAEHYDVVLWDTPNNMPQDPKYGHNPKVADFRAVDVLAGGDTADIALTFQLPESFDGTYEITVTPSNGSDSYNNDEIYRLAEDKTEIVLSSTDIFVKAEALWAASDIPVVKGTVTNSSPVMLSNIDVTLYRANDSGEEQAIGTETISIDAECRGIVSFTLDSVSAEDYYILRAAEQPGEINTTNNEDFCVFQTDAVQETDSMLNVTNIQTNSHGIQATVNVTSSGETGEHRPGLIAAAYREDGAMVAYQEISIQENGTYPIALSGENIQILRCFLLDMDTFKPLGKSVEKLVTP